MSRQPTPDLLATAQPADDALGMAIGPQVMALNIADVRLDGGTQPRAGINQAVVEDYASDMEANGAEFPPVQVVYDGADYWLWDGFHRLHARKRNGLYTVPAIVRQGTRRDAVLLSVGANATHGFRRTNSDKRRAVLALLHDQEWAQWSDREIARRCAVSNQFVSNVRAELSVNGGQMPAERRVERNGTQYTMTPPKRSAAPAVASQEGTAPAPVQQEPEIAADARRPQPQRGREMVFETKQINREIVNWRQMRGTITEDGRILVQMSNGAKNPPWLELDDAGQHWMIDMIRKAQGTA